MKKIISIAVCFVILLSCVLPVQASGGVPEKVMDATKSVVRILSKCYNGSATGSGFVIKNEPGEVLIATNDHVVSGNPYSISVWVGENELVDAEIVFTTSAKDLCVLRVTDPVDMKPLTLSTEDPQHGAAIYVVGYPGAGDILSDTQAHTSESVTITDGIISAIRTFTIESGADPVKLLQVNAAINSGNSGGPLFNSEGIVIGVNTYKVNADSQGVFGSVDISELWNLLEQHGIEIATQPQEVIPEAKAFPVTTIAIAASAVAVLLVVLLFIKTKKKKAKSLRKFMEAHPNGLGISEAVSLLLPVAIQIRDLHSNGKLHLQISPDSILVSASEVTLKESSKKENDRLASGFAAPEIYKGVGFGAASDIYSLAAVVYFTATGKTPVNSLQSELMEEELLVLEKQSHSFAGIIRKSMAFRSQDRTQSMQELIYSVSAFSTQISKLEPQVNKIEPVKILKEGKKIKPRRKLAPISVFLIFGVILASLLWNQYVQPAIDTRNEAAQIEEAYNLAVSLMDAGKYEEAIDAFASLIGYKDSEERQDKCRIAIENAILEEKYQYAASLSENGEYSKAALLFARLDDYKDSRERSFDMWSHVPGRKTISLWWDDLYVLTENGTIMVDRFRIDEDKLDEPLSNYFSEYQDIVSLHGFIGLKYDGTLVLPDDRKLNNSESYREQFAEVQAFNAFVNIQKNYREELKSWENIVFITEHTTSFGFFGAIGITEDGKVLSVGLNEQNKKTVESWSDIVAVDLSHSYVIGLKADGTVVASGNNDWGQCNVEDWTDIVAVGIDPGGGEKTLGLKSDGTVVAVGSNLTGALKNVATWKDIVMLEGPCGIKNDGTVKETSHASLSGSPNVSNWSNIVSISTNDQHTVGLRSDGTLIFSNTDHEGFSEARNWTKIQLP